MAPNPNLSRCLIPIKCCIIIKYDRLSSRLFDHFVRKYEIGRCQRTLFVLQKTVSMILHFVLSPKQTNVWMLICTEECIQHAKMSSTLCVRIYDRDA